MFKSAVRSATGKLPIRALQRLTGQKPCILLSHAASDCPPDHLQHLYAFRSIPAFRHDLDRLLRHFVPVDLAQFTAWAVAAGSLPRNALHLTFDDGLREAVEVIAPICREKGIPATFFLTTRFIDNQYLGDRHLASLLVGGIERLSETTRINLWEKLAQKFPGRINGRCDWKVLLLAKKSGDRQFLDDVAVVVGIDQAEYLRGQRPYATSDEIKSLMRDGFAIGAHTLDHPYFPLISPAEQVRQTVESARLLEAAFGLPCTSFAFPFGAHQVAPDFYDTVRRNSSISLFFDAGGKIPTDRGQVLDRLALDLPDSVPLESVFGRAYAASIERRIWPFRF